MEISIAAAMQVSPLFARLQQLIECYEPRAFAPELELARRELAKMQCFHAEQPRDFECAQYRLKRSFFDQLNPPHLVCSFYYVLEQKRIYGIVHDDFRDTTQRVVIIRDHALEYREQFSAQAVCVLDRSDTVYSATPREAEQLYKMIGDLHQGANRIFAAR